MYIIRCCNQRKLTAYVCSNFIFSSQRIDYWRDSLYTGKAETEKHQFIVYYVYCLHNILICVRFFLRYVTRLRLCLCLVREAGIWARCGCRWWCYLICPCTEPPELQLLRCQQPAHGLTVTPSAGVPFQVCWGRQICHEIANVIIFMICIIQARVGCGFKGIWLSFTALQFIWLLLIKLFVTLFVASTQE